MRQQLHSKTSAFSTIWILGLGVGAWAAHPMASGQDDEGLEFFESKIRPLMLDHCASCHGEDKQRSGLRLDRYGSILVGGERGATVVPGDPDASRLIQAVRYDDEELLMPPRGRLRGDQIADLERWVEMGAPGPTDEGAVEIADEFDLEARAKELWSFQPLRPTPPPTVSNADWNENPVDAFLHGPIVEAGLEPSPLADKATLLRRLSFDLRGLPPTPEELLAFEQDSSPDAWEKVVDRYLASPAYAERWGRHWLDLMRYCETRGHEFDYRDPNVFQYRDYVIRAFEADVPYDDLVVEHLAGDLLEEPRRNVENGWNESILGTGWWHLTDEVHSPVDIRGDECLRVANMVDTMSRAFLGMTVACARCHDHKFDPISSEDFYALAGHGISSSYRPFRFETDEVNRAVARDLAELSARNARAASSEVGRSLSQQARGTAALMIAAHRALVEGAVPDDELPTHPRGDILFEDFERNEWAPWSAEGTAFGAGPRRIDEIAGYQGDLNGRGEFVVNTHETRSGEDVREADVHLGVLTGPEFTVERDFIHFLIGGGSDREKLGLELWVDDARVRHAVGRDSNRMEPGTFEVSEYLGKTAFLRIVDQRSGGWGQVGCDHIVFSDQQQLPGLHSPERSFEHPGWSERIRRIAEASGLEDSRVLSWMRVLSGSGSGSDAAVAVVREVRGESESIGERLQGLAEESGSYEDRIRNWRLEGLTRLDFTSEHERWMANGPSFGVGPVERGTLIPGRSIDEGFVGVIRERSAALDDLWNVLELAPETEEDPSNIRWVQAGRTLKTATFELERGILFHRVRGQGHIHAVVCSHRMLNGPLHGRILRDFSFDDDEFHWVRQDLRPYIGERVHVEYSPESPHGDQGLGTAPFAVAALVEHGEDPPVGDRWPGAFELSERLSEGASFLDAARAFEGLLIDAGSSLGGAPSDSELALADWMLRSPELFGAREDLEASVSTAGRAWLEGRESCAERIARRSAVAPILWEGTGVHEYLLVRGSPRSPADPVPRSFLSGLSSQAGGARDDGQSRLELARELVAESNPLFARVMVNRVWHHLFGRGLVPSVDNFGVLGQAPTHPELLDFLALEFIEDGYGIRRLIRRLVATRAYRQVSTPQPASTELDPTNRLLHRASVRRLEGEAIRDAILSLSGRLDTKRYGPSVRLHLTPFLEGRGRPSESGPLDGAGRRSIYQALHRNFLPPFFLAFDYPSPAATVGRRSISNVPAQALVLMNDPFVVAESRRWAEHLLDEVPDDAAARLDLAYRMAFARSPDELEREAALNFLGAAEGNPHDVDRWSDFVHVLWNVKEFIFIR